MNDTNIGLRRRDKSDMFGYPENENARIRTAAEWTFSINYVTPAPVVQ